jgi:DNA-binding NarL/FixJ family response regulator
MEGEYKIIIVDDHKLFREGLSFVISQIKGFCVVGEASTGHSFLGMLDHLSVDIVLMDISMPGINGITATEQALLKHPDLKIIAFTMFCDREYYDKMVRAGVVGYLLKDSGTEELTRALRTVIAGERFYSQKLLHKIILNSTGQIAGIKPLPAQGIRLSPIEAEVLKLVCQGYSNSQISDKLSISLRALEDYKTEMITRTGVKDILNLAIFALKNNLVDL